eukprot:257271-Chlamydomonas_euryale.AAC.2
MQQTSPCRTPVHAANHSMQHASPCSNPVHAARQSMPCACCSFTHPHRPQPSPPLSPPSPHPIASSLSRHLPPSLAYTTFDPSRPSFATRFVKPSTCFQTDSDPACPPFHSNINPDPVPDALRRAGQRGGGGAVATAAALPVAS